MKKLNSLYDWFYAPQSALVVAVYRIAIGTFLLLTVLLFYAYLDPYFSTGGYVTKEYAATVMAPNSFSIFFWNDSSLFVHAMYLLLVVSCISFITGVGSRLSGILCYVLYLSFYNRFTGIGYDGSTVLIIAFFFTLFLETDRALTPRWYQRWRAPTSNVPGWPVRLIQIQLATIYMFAAMAKMRGDGAWLDGTQVVNSLTWQYATFNLWWLSLLPFLNNILTLGTVFLEFAFPFMVWRPQTRPPEVYGMFILHIATAIFMNVTYFGEVMASCLILCLTGSEIRQFFAFLKRLGKGVHCMVTTIRTNP